MRRHQRRAAPPQGDRRRLRDEDDEGQARSWCARRMEPLDSLREFRRICISRSISDGERGKYINKANECIARTGGISFWHQLQYIKLVSTRMWLAMHNALGAFDF
jgi:hypothetical protein